MCLNAMLNKLSRFDKKKNGTWNIPVFKCSIQKGNLNKFSRLENEN